MPPVTAPGGVGGSLGSGKEPEKKSSGLAPSYDILGKDESVSTAEGTDKRGGTTSVIPSMGTGPGGYTPPMKVFTPPSKTPSQNSVEAQLPTNLTPEQNVTVQRAVGYLMKHDLAITPANIQYAIKTGRLQPDVR